MALDPSIAMGVRPIQFESPLNALAQALQVQNLQQQNQLGGVNLATQQQAQEERNKLRALFADPSFNMQDPSSVQRVMSVSPERGMQFQKTMLENRKDQSTIDKNSSEILAKRTALYRDSLANVNDPQTAAQYVTAIYNDPVFKGTPVTSGPLEQALARIPQDPQGFAQWKQQEALGATKFIEMNAPKITSQDTGGAVNVVATPGLGGTPQVLSTTRKTATPDAVLRDSREAKAPQGYRYKQDGSMEAIPGGPADFKQTGMFNADQAQMSGTEAGLDRLAVSANELLKHPGLVSITGVRGAIPNIPGTQAADAQAKLNTLKSQVGFGVLQDMRNASKTGGALGNVSDAEGKRLEANLAALENAQSLEQFQQQLQKIIQYTDQAKNRLHGAFNMKYQARMNGGAAPAAQPAPAAPAANTGPAKIASDAEYNALPSGATFIGPDGKTRRKP